MSTLRCLGVLVLLSVVLSGTASAQTSAHVPIHLIIPPGSLQVSASGTLVFVGSRRHSDGTLTAVVAPRIEIVDERGSGAGWHVSFRATDLVGPSTIPAADLTFAASGGTIRSIVGPASGVFETGAPAQPLSGPVKALAAAAGSGQGITQYAPDAQSFRLILPADLAAGQYAGTFVATIASGP